MILVEDRPGGVLLQGKGSLRENEIQPGHHMLVFRKLHRMLPGEGAQRSEHLFDLFEGGGEFFIRLPGKRGGFRPPRIFEGGRRFFGGLLRAEQAESV